MCVGSVSCMLISLCRFVFVYSTGKCESMKMLHLTADRIRMRTHQKRRRKKTHTNKHESNEIILHWVSVCVCVCVKERWKQRVSTRAREYQTKEEDRNKVQAREWFNNVQQERELHIMKKIYITTNIDVRVCVCMSVRIHFSTVLRNGV